MIRMLKKSSATNGDGCTIGKLLPRRQFDLMIMLFIAGIQLVKCETPSEKTDHR